MSPGKIADRHRGTVALFIPHLGIGGAELQLGLLAPRLRDAGWEPFVATIEDLHGTAGRLTAAGVEVELVPRKGHVGLDTVAALARVIRRRRADLVHAWLWASNWRAAVARPFARDVGVIASIRSMEDDLGPLNLLAYRMLSPLIDAILVNSRAVLERSSERTGISREKYRLVRNAVDLDRLDADSHAAASLPWDPLDAPVVGYVGTLHPRKRAVSLATIAARVVARVPAARFLVVGDGPERKPLEERCARLGVAEHVALVGYAERIGPYLRRMNVLIHPSMNEGSSNAILEAMAAGIPVAAYAVSGNREVVVHGETGYLVPDGDEAALAAAAVDVLDDPKAARRLGAAGRSRVERDFSIETMVRSTTAVYEEVLTRCGRSSAKVTRT